MASVAWHIFWLTIVAVGLVSASSIARPVNLQTKEIAYADPDLFKQLNQVFLEHLIGMRSRHPGGPLYKRSNHLMEARSINQFKNCYFSPVQCILLERRRR